MASQGRVKQGRDDFSRSTVHLFQVTLHTAEEASRKFSCVFPLNLHMKGYLL